MRNHSLNSFMRNLYPQVISKLMKDDTLRRNQLLCLPVLNEARQHAGHLKKKENKEEN